MRFSNRESSNPGPSNRAWSADEMQDQRDQRDDQQKVDQSAGDVQNAPAENPCDQQNDKQDGENTHG